MRGRRWGGNFSLRIESRFCVWVNGARTPDIGEIVVDDAEVDNVEDMISKGVMVVAEDVRRDRVVCVITFFDERQKTFNVVFSNSDKVKGFIRYLVMIGNNAMTEICDVWKVLGVKGWNDVY